jgi:hypothetical protein
MSNAWRPLLGARGQGLPAEQEADLKYFEAELGDLDRGDVNYQSPTGKWTIAGGTVVTRTGDASKGFAFSV